MTVDYTVKLLASAKGEKIVARGRVIKPSQVMTVAAADVYAVNWSDEKLCATAFVTSATSSCPRTDGTATGGWVFGVIGTAGWPSAVYWVS
jgi:hypothetical protein